MNLNGFFSAKSIAIVGVSRDPDKVGHVIFRNFTDGGFAGEVYPVNPKAGEILGRKTHPSVAEIDNEVDMAVIAVPAKFVAGVVGECGQKNIRNVIIVSAGFREAGNAALDRQLEQALKNNNIRCIGPNCLGIYDAQTQLDTLFLPRSRLERPESGGISFVTQSGAVGSAILDYAADRGYGFSKFVSYGNAMDIDESDIIDYLGRDRSTKVICVYVEGAKDGRKFLETCKRVSKKKPIIAIKGGKTEAGTKAIVSHTGSLAGSAEVYSGAFRQARVVEAHSLEDMFSFVKVLENCVAPKGGRVMVITNGGGYGILSSDALVEQGLEMAEWSSESAKRMGKEKEMSAVEVHNPMDLLGDTNTERYHIALNAALDDNNIDAILLVALYQTPRITTNLVDVIVEANDLAKKPIVCVSTGGDFTEVLQKNLEKNNIPVFAFPENAASAIRRLVDYYLDR